MATLLSQTLIGLVVLFQVIILGISFVRFWVLRHRKQRATEKTASVLFAFAMAAHSVNFSMVVYSNVKEIKIRSHYTGLQAENLLFASEFLKIIYVMSVIYTVELYTMKAAFISYYWGLFEALDSNRKYPLYVVSAIVPMSFLASLGILLFWVTPISINWSDDLQLVITEAPFGSLLVCTVTSWLHICTDLLVMGIPLLAITSLRLRAPEKPALVFIFAMGGLSMAASVSRYADLYQHIKKPPLTPETIHILEIWGSVEMAAATIAFSLPSLRAFYLRCVLPCTQADPQQQRGYSRNGSKPKSSNTDASTLLTNGGREIDPNGHHIMVKRTFDVHREAWASNHHEDLEMCSIDSSEAVVGGGNGFIDPLKQDGRSFGVYATAEVVSISGRSVCQ